MEPVEDEITILIAELVQGDPRKAWCCNRILQIAAFYVDKNTEAARRDLAEMVMLATTIEVRSAQHPTPEDYPL